MWTWLAIPWVRKLGEIVLLLVALFAVVHYIYHRGKQAGLAEEGGRQVEGNKVQFDRLNATFQAQLSAGQVRETQLAQLATQFASLAAQAATRVQTAQQQSTNDATKVASLPDSAVRADLELKLGGPLTDPAVLRRDDTIVTDYPHKVDEAKAAEEQLTALNQSLDTAQSQTTNARQERDAAVTAYNGLVPLYAQAYDVAIRGHRRWYCLWLCKPKTTIGLPAPVTLTPVVSHVK